MIYNLYGSTEIAWATIATPSDLLEAPGTVGARRRTPGRDRRRRRTAAARRGERGHLRRNEMLFEGYTDGRAGRERSADDDRRDLGHLDEQGRLFVDRARTT